MSNQQDKARAFHALHIKGDPVVLYNMWDVGSAKAVEKAGAKALATGSRAVAGALGCDDGESLPLDEAIQHVARIVSTTELPVTMDFEGGYSRDVHVLRANALVALGTGVIGFNFEDQIVGTDSLYGVVEQCERIAALRDACSQANVDVFINARTDIFLKAPRDTHCDAMVDHALERSAAYRDVGASGFFIPGLVDPALLARICLQSALPINVMTMAGAPSNRQLADMGVARISYGPGPWRLAMAYVEESARAVYS